jgi:hypothetical protein
MRVAARFMHRYWSNIPMKASKLAVCWNLFAWLLFTDTTH